MKENWTMLRMCLCACIHHFTLCVCVIVCGPWQSLLAGVWRLWKRLLTKHSSVYLLKVYTNIWNVWKLSLVRKTKGTSHVKPARQSVHHLCFFWLVGIVPTRDRVQFTFRSFISQLSLVSEDDRLRVSTEGEDAVISRSHVPFVRAPSDIFRLLSS